jgi:ribosomal protein S18 acetylase RimI-like enzyme
MRIFPLLPPVKFINTIIGHATPPKFGMATTLNQDTFDHLQESPPFSFETSPSGQTFYTVHQPDITFIGPEHEEYKIIQWNPEQIDSEDHSEQAMRKYALFDQVAFDINRINAIGIGESQEHYIEGNIPKGWAAHRAMFKRGDKPGEWYTTLHQTIKQLQSKSNQYELLFRYNINCKKDELVGFTLVENLVPPIEQKASVTQELHAIYLLPKARKLGIGAHLLKNMIDRAQQEGCERIILDVGPKNEDAINLYTAVGFNMYNELAPVPWGDKFLRLNQLELTRDQFDDAKMACQRIIEAKRGQ